MAFVFVLRRLPAEFGPTDSRPAVQLPKILIAVAGGVLGTAVRLDIEDAATLGLVALFQVLTAPVISQLIGRAAYRAGSMRRDLVVVVVVVVVVDELEERLSREQPDGAD